jgi:hypothetical protein
MSTSLDGFIAGPNEGPDNGLGDDGKRLHEWFFAGTDADRKEASGRLAGINGTVVDEARSSPAGGPSSLLTAGAAITTTACRSSSSTATTPTI